MPDRLSEQPRSQHRCSESTEGRRKERRGGPRVNSGTRFPLTLGGKSRGISSSEGIDNFLRSSVSKGEERNWLIAEGKAGSREQILRWKKFCLKARNNLGEESIHVGKTGVELLEITVAQTGAVIPPITGGNECRYRLCLVEVGRADGSPPLRAFISSATEEARSWAKRKTGKEGAADRVRRNKISLGEQESTDQRHVGTATALRAPDVTSPEM